MKGVALLCDTFKAAEHDHVCFEFEADCCNGLVVFGGEQRLSFECTYHVCDNGGFACAWRSLNELQIPLEGGEGLVLAFVERLAHFAFV